MFKLSIITINRNNAQGLLKTIESVVSQTFTEFEYIVINGASTDESVNIIMNYANKIDYWISEPDKGIYNAMNKGILQAKGVYLLFLNSGDWLFEETTLSKIFNKIRNTDIIAGNICKTRVIETSPEIFAIRNLLIKNIPHQAMFIKKELFIKYEFYDENLKILSDYLFNLKMCLIGVTYCYINETITNYDTTGISSDDNQYQTLLAEQKYIYNKILPPSILEDYNFFLNKKGLAHPALRWVIDNKYLFKIIKALNLIFNKQKNVYF